MFPTGLLNALIDSPDRCAFEHEDRTVSYGELHETVRRFASQMRAAGLGPGRGVAVAMPLSPEAFAVYLAAHALGCRVVALRPGWDGPRLEAVLASGIDLMIDEHTFDPAKTADALPPTVTARPDDIARVTFTSGSTGRPKGCALTYRTYGLAYDPGHWAPELARLMTAFTRFLAFGSFAMPVMMTFAGRCLMTGGTVVLDDGPPAQAIVRHRITAAVCTVPMLRKVLAGGDLALPSLRALVVTGSPADPCLLEEAAERLGKIVWQGYGQGESGMISLLTPDDPDLTSVGRPLSTVEVRIDGGRILVRSPHLMAGYVGDPEQTAEVLRDGWLDTRDLGHLDEDGYLHLTGRSQEVIMVDATLCHPGPIERVLTGHPDVAEACVAGVPDPLTGEAVHAFIVPSGPAAPDHDELRGLVRTALGAAAVPAAFTLIGSIPLTPGGKPDKRALVGRLLSSSPCVLVRGSWWPRTTPSRPGSSSSTSSRKGTASRSSATAAPRSPRPGTSSPIWWCSTS